MDIDSDNENILIVAPTGQDASLASEIFRRAGLGSEVFPRVPELLVRLQSSCGMIFLAEEALNIESAGSLRQALLNQEAWSDLPVLIMVSSQGRGPSGQKVLDLFGPTVNVSLIERPFHTTTLISSVKVFLRARRRQYQVRHLLNELTDALRQRDEFVSIASHELKTPLTALKLQNQISKRALSSEGAHLLTPDKIARSVETADRQLDRLSVLVEDLLDVSRIRAGKLKIETADFDLSQLTKQVVEQLAPQLAAAGSAIQFEGTDEALGCWDSLRIEQVVTNLISNAIKYGSGKPIRVSVSVIEEKAVLSVQDQGVGILPEDQVRIFERFERVASENKVSGLGLGLYIVRQIVEMHGGRIWVESTLGRGSTFKVELPLRERAKERRARLG
ncbi:MAG: HAMP domain-containing sensor histidine kinase [Bdellovibrionota bacterium]